MSTSAAEAVAAYDARAAYCRAETTSVAPPRLLHPLLTGCTHVAEVPCGTGHFIAEYAAVGLTVTLADANPVMLGYASEQAEAVGLPPHRTTLECAYLNKLRLSPTVDAVIVPNAALNQLLCHAGTQELIEQLRAATTRRDVRVLAQVMCGYRDHTDVAGFYDQTRPHGMWFTDKRFEPAHADGVAVRRRRQQRHGDQLHIEFDYRDSRDRQLHTAVVDLLVVDPVALIAAFAAAGFSEIRFLPGDHGLSELLAVARRVRG
ncbi:class I SAM-dependent methyltransferase [Nocardia sp. NPDC052278]|uniref:class I SAM-dependent methyltransferase n=1 Tax=unclassified Nocardia TaxID=2637762 RepID=UPI0036AF8E2E